MWWIWGVLLFFVFVCFAACKVSSRVSRFEETEEIRHFIKTHEKLEQVKTADADNADD